MSSRWIWDKFSTSFWKLCKKALVSPFGKSGNVATLSARSESLLHRKSLRHRCRRLASSLWFIDIKLSVSRSPRLYSRLLLVRWTNQQHRFVWAARDAVPARSEPEGPITTVHDGPRLLCLPMADQAPPQPPADAGQKHWQKKNLKRLQRYFQETAIKLSLRACRDREFLSESCEQQWRTERDRRRFPDTPSPGQPRAGRPIKPSPTRTMADHNHRIAITETSPVTRSQWLVWSEWSL